MNLKKRNKITDYVLAVMMLLTLLNSANFFLLVVKLSIVNWLAYNACSLSIIVFLICFICFKITRKELFRAIALVPMYYYGTMGLLVIPWNEVNMFAQITHIIITLNVAWILYGLLKESKYEPLGRGLLTGILIFFPVFALINSYLQVHLTEITTLMQQVKH